MKSTALVLLLLLTLVPVAGQAGEERIKLNAALDSFRSKYVSSPNHKAFAQSPEGTWAWVSDRTSAAVAVQDAIDNCNGKREPGQQPCLVIHVDDRWMP